MSKFWQSPVKMPYKITKNPFRGLIQMQKSIEFQLHLWKITQLSPYYCASIIRGLILFPDTVLFSERMKNAYFGLKTFRKLKINQISSRASYEISNWQVPDFFHYWKAMEFLKIMGILPKFCKFHSAFLKIEWFQGTGGTPLIEPLCKG